MKIRIITIHSIPNFGSVFQSYALCKYIQSIGQFDVQLIDYDPPYFNKLTLRTFIARILNYNHYLKRKNKFSTFVKEYIPLTKEHFSSYQKLCDFHFDADVYIAGGDQLWNVYHDSGKDDAFKLCFTNGNKMSYATSMGQTDFSDAELSLLCTKIQDFKHISVRESSSVSLLNQGGIKAVHCVDPVYLLTRNDYLPFIKKINQPKYLLVYLVTPSDLLEKCIEYLSKKYKLKVILCSGFSKKCTCDLFLKDLGPDEILSYIANAEIVLSSSFHATSFSIIFQKQFFTILPDEHTNERIIDLLSIRGLLNRIIRNTDEINERMIEQIDYAHITNYSLEVKKSKEYLRKALSEFANGNA